MALRLKNAREAFLDVVDFVAGKAKASPNAVYAGSVPYLMLTGNLVAGWQMGRALLVAQDKAAKGEDVAFMQAKVVTAQFYAEHILTRTTSLRDSILAGGKAPVLWRWMLSDAKVTAVSARCEEYGRRHLR